MNPDNSLTGLNPAPLDPDPMALIPRPPPFHVTQDGLPVWVLSWEEEFPRHGTSLVSAETAEDAAKQYLADNQDRLAKRVVPLTNEVACLIGFEHDRISRNA